MTSANGTQTAEARVERLEPGAPIARMPLVEEDSVPREPGAGDGVEPEPEPRASARGRARPRRARGVFLALLSSCLVAGGAAYWRTRGYGVTDDAQVEGRVASVSSRVVGHVRRVVVSDNQRVEPGDLLVELDDRDFLTRLEAARADLKRATASRHAAGAALAIAESSVEADLVAATAAVSAAQSKLTFARDDVRRSQALWQSAVVPQTDVARSQMTQDEAAASLYTARAHLATLRAPASREGPFKTARVEAARAEVEVTEAGEAQAHAAEHQAELEESYAQVRADVAGVVSHRSVEVGQLAAPDRPLMSIVSLDDVWVVAHFKEDQIARIEPGQRARVRVDAFQDRDLAGSVETIAGTTGSRFSLLPPENASGNFTKVVQRVTVWIRLDDVSGARLRPGMSADVRVKIR